MESSSNYDEVVFEIGTSSITSIAFMLLPLLLSLPSFFFLCGLRAEKEVVL